MKLVDELESNYEKIAAQPDQAFLTSWDTQRLYIEMARVIRGELSIANAPILTKYFPQAAEEHATMPKFIFLSGHSTNVEALLWLFGERALTSPPESSSVWVNYYVDQYSYDPSTAFSVEVVYCRNSEDYNECRTITYDKFNQSSSGLNTSVNFENWLQTGLEDYLEFSNIASTEIERICEAPYSYDPERRPYLSPSQFYIDLFRHFGIDPRKRLIQEQASE